MTDPSPSSKGSPDLLVGVISDTHGLLRPRALAVLRGADLILHAGDVGSQQVLDELSALGPALGLRAVRGNMDPPSLSRSLPSSEVVQAGPHSLYLLHDLGLLDLDPGIAGFAAVIFGHTHRPSVRRRDGVLYVNPGSAGPRRSDRPASVVRLHVRGRGLEAEIVELD